MTPDDFNRPAIKSGDSEMFTESDGTMKWLRGKVLHRADGPALIWPDGTQKWFYNGELHRTDGPAVEWGSGRADKDAWYLHGEQKTPEEVKAWALDQRHVEAVAAKTATPVNANTVVEGMSLGTTRPLALPKVASFRKLQP